MTTEQFGLQITNQDSGVRGHKAFVGKGFGIVTSQKPHFLQFEPEIMRELEPGG